MTKRSFRNNILWLACVATMPVTVTAEAVEERVYPFYLGGTLGIARGQVNASDMNERMLSLGYDIDANVNNLTRVAWGLVAGYQWTSYLATEVGYVNLGEVRTELSGSAADIDDYLNSANLVHPRSASGLELAALGKYPLNDKTYLYARGGILLGDSRYRANDGANFSARSSSNNIATYGLGVGYQLHDDWQLRAGLNRYHLDGERLMLAGISLLYQFHYTRYRTTSVDIIPEPAPVPVIIPSTDLLVTFDTDSARVDERYYPDLRELVALMNEYPEIGVLLEGHTDSRGSAAYNQELAERRALAVRELLVDGLGIAPERVSTKAYGLTKPIADNQSIEGRAANRRVTAEIVFPSD